MKHVQRIVQDPTDAIDYIGLEGEAIVERGTYGIRVHDGQTPGGFLTLTEAIARALFLTSEDFDTAIAQIITDLNTINDAAEASILASVLISRGPVEEIRTAPPVSPTIGDRFLVAHAGVTGAFVGFNDQVVQYISTTEFRASGTPLDGHQVFNEDDQTMYYYASGTTTWATTNPDVTLDGIFSAIDTALNLKAPLASPVLTGTPTAPTAAPGTDNTQIATTAYVDAAVVAAGEAVATIAEMEAGTENFHPVSPAVMKYSEFCAKGFVAFHWSGSAVVITHKSDTVDTVTRTAQGRFQITMTGGLNFVAGYAVANGGAVASPASAGSLGMGVSFSGTNPSFTVRFGDAGGSGGQLSDPSDACVVIFGATQNT